MFKTFRIPVLFLALAALPSLAQDSGTKPAPPDSATLLHQASQGDAEALYELGLLHATGAQGVEKSPAKAHECLMKAAAKKHPQAMNCLGVMALNGDGVTQDRAAARDWFDKAEAGGSVDALNNIAVMFANAQGVGDDGFNQARGRFEQASRKGCPAATFNLALLHLKGKMPSSEPATARALFILAAKAGHAKAAYNAGVMCATGQGGKEDMKSALAYFSQAAKGGDPKARAKLRDPKSKAMRQNDVYEAFLLAGALGADTQQGLNPVFGPEPASTQTPPSLNLK